MSNPRKKEKTQDIANIVGNTNKNCKMKRMNKEEKSLRTIMIK